MEYRINKMSKLILRVLLLTILLLLVLPISASAATTLTVPTDDYGTIQAAINAANSGDTVFVQTGTYYEHLIIQGKSITLQGEDKATTIIDGLGTGIVINVPSTNDVTISNLTVLDSTNTRAYPGINIHPASSYNTVKNVILSGHNMGINNGDRSSQHNTFENVEAYSNVAGIQAFSGSHYMKVLNCNLHDNSHVGVLIGWSSYWTIENTIVSSNYNHGILVDTSSYGTIKNCEIFDNSGGIGHGEGILISGYHQNNNQIIGNKLYSNEIGLFIADYSSTANTVTENQIYDNRVAGIALQSVNGNIIYNNCFNNPTNVLPYSSSASNSWDNGISGNYWSDYTGSDIGSDGIGDVSYTINALNVDHYPLMKSCFNQLPIANAGGSYQATEGSEITFDAFASSDPDGDALQYRWDFESDGTWDTEWSNEPTATHTWNDDWSGTATVEVSDGGLTDVDTASVVVANMDPLVDLGTQSVVEDLTLLTDSPAYELCPVWTTDSKIIYLFEDDVWNNRDIYIMNADGSNKQPLGIDVPNLAEISDISPDGKELLLVRTSGNWFDIYKLNIETKTLTALAEDSTKVECYGFWSPDGTKIAYIQDNELWMMDADGENKHIICGLADLGSEKPWMRVGPALDWTPDGTKIVFSVADTDHYDDLWIINSDKTGLTQLTNTDYSEWHPTFSPDGKYIAYASSEGNSGIYQNKDMWIRNLDGTYKERLTTDFGVHDATPHWSADGTQIVFCGNQWPAPRGGADIALLKLNLNKPLVNEGEVVSFSGSYNDAGNADTHIVEWDFGDSSIASDSLTPSHVYADNGEYTVTLTVTDDDGGIGTDTLTVTVNNVDPVLSSILSPLDPCKLNTPITTSSSFTDGGILDTHTAVWDWGDGITTAGIVAETNGAGTVTGEHAYSNAGIYWVTLTVIDNDGGSAIVTSEYCVVIYDPEGGFVTGGGWIDSPADAYVPDTTLEGKATFGFVSKYQKGATVPTGNTEFQFKVADLNFKSTSYDWLVVAGSQSKYKGTGIINGAGEYGFMLIAVDGAITGDGMDKFRIKIWDKATDAIVYDNEVGVSEDAAPSTVIGGGSIVLHKAK